jgi:hypothetical protein
MKQSKELRSAIREFARLVNNGYLDSHPSVARKISWELGQMNNSKELEEKRVLRVIKLMAEVLADQQRQREER